MKYKKGTYLTRYHGEAFTDRADACRCFPQTHSTQHNDLYIVGIQEPEVGKGMGSFANHSTGGNNASVLRVGSAIVLVADRDIEEGEEIFLSYGRPPTLEHSAGGDSYRVAMGTAQYVVTTNDAGEDDIAFVAMLTDDGKPMRYMDTDAQGVLRAVARDNLLELTNVSAVSYACFLRCVALGLHDLLARPNSGGIVGSFLDRARQFLVDVNVPALAREEADDRGVTKMRTRLGEFVLDHVRLAWGCIYDPKNSTNDETVGDMMTTFALAEFGKGFLEEMEKDVQQAANRNAQGEQDGSWSRSGYKADYVVGKLQGAINCRTGDSGQFTSRMVAYMFGVDVYIYDVRRYGISHPRPTPRPRPHRRPRPRPRPRQRTRQRTRKRTPSRTRTRPNSRPNSCMLNVAPGVT